LEDDFELSLGADNYGHPYDYWSITHYPEDGHAKAFGLKTILTLDPQYQNIIGNAKLLSKWVRLSPSFLLFFISSTILLFSLDTGRGED